jgi:hypothetical protein
MQPEAAGLGKELAELLQMRKLSSEPSGKVASVIETIAKGLSKHSLGQALLAMMQHDPEIFGFSNPQWCALFEGAVAGSGGKRLSRAELDDLLAPLVSLPGDDRGPTTRQLDALVKGIGGCRGCADLPKVWATLQSIRIDALLKRVAAPRTVSHTPQLTP